MYRFHPRDLWKGWVVLVWLFWTGARVVVADPFVPGLGTKVSEVGDDFEDERWEYYFNNPKSSQDIDRAERYPTGEAANGRWYEGLKRGHPDIIKRVPTPANGLPGSRGSLLLQSLNTGVPGAPRYRLGQDDFIADVNYRLGGVIPVSRAPSVVVRVFLPPVDRWEDRTGTHFGLRASLRAAGAGSRDGSTSSANRPVPEVYWVGMFIDFESKGNGRPHDYAYFRLRADYWGNDFRSRQITTTGWWTLGLSFSPDGMVHFYARPGVEALTEADRLTSEYPYGLRANSLRTFFFNVCSGDDGRSWSTPWVLDDPTVYVLR